MPIPDQRRTFNAALLLLCGSISTIASATAAPRGHLAYLQNGYAVVSNLASGQAKRLPRSKGAKVLSLSPRGLAVYFTQKPGYENDGPIPQDGFLSRRPYQNAQKLPAALQGETFGQLNWSPSGTTLWLRGFEIGGAYTPATNRFTKSGTLPDSASRDGKTLAYLGSDEIRVRDIKSGRERVIFSIKKPQPMIAALKNAKNPAKLSDFKDLLSSEPSKNSSDWALSTPTLAPDGSRLYFCSNLGTGQGAAGNSSWAVFAANLKTGRISVLSKLGTQFGRMPNVFEVSPDGKRLLALVSVHSSAVENPFYALVVDLLTQNSRQLMSNLAPKNTDSNDVDGAVWSPDGKYVALAAFFYKTETAWKNIDNWKGPADKDWTLFIQDAATGKTVRRVVGAREPSWGN